MSKFSTVWFYDSGKSTDTFKYVASFVDDSQLKPSLVGNIKPPNHSACHSFNSSDPDGRQMFFPVGTDFAGIIPLWYVFVENTFGGHEMRSIFGYADDSFPVGTIVDFTEAASRGVKFNDSVGFVQWFKHTSELQQIYVSEQYRRQRLSLKLISVADLVIVSDNNWNGLFLNGGEVTTNDGEHLRSAWSASTRVKPRLGSLSGGPSGD